MILFAQKMVKIKLILRPKTDRPTDCESNRALHQFFALDVYRRKRIFVIYLFFARLFPLISCHIARVCLASVRVSGEKTRNNFTTNVIVFIWINSWRNTNQICFCHTKCCNFGLRLYFYSSVCIPLFKSRSNFRPDKELNACVYAQLICESLSCAYRWELSFLFVFACAKSEKIYYLWWCLSISNSRLLLNE